MPSLRLGMLLRDEEWFADERHPVSGYGGMDSDFMLSQEFRQNPYPFYSELRAQSPIYWSEHLRVWLATSYGDALAVLKDGRCSSDFTLANRFEEGARPLAPMMRKVLLFMDAPDHTRVRGHVAGHFGPHEVAELRPAVEAIVHSLLDSFDDRAEVDLIEEFAFPLPVMVMCRVLGVPREDWGRFQRGWSRSIVATLDPIEALVDDRRSPVEESLGAVVELVQYFGLLAEERKLRPVEDVFGALVAARETQGGVSIEEFIGAVLLLFVAGHETTMNLIGNGVFALLQHPTALERLRESPWMIKSAVEEFLRFESPAQMTSRIVREPLEIGETKIGAGEQVIVCLAAANRDSNRFEYPDELDIGRPNNRHLAFGGGMHFCLGAHLARLEAQVAIERLLKRSPGLRLAEAPDWRGTIATRGVGALRVIL